MNISPYANRVKLSFQSGVNCKRENEKLSDEFESDMLCWYNTATVQPGSVSRWTEHVLLKSN